MVGLEIHVPSHIPTGVTAKFGGECLVDKLSWNYVGQAVQGLLENNMRPLIVVSAIKGMTDLLLSDVYGRAVVGGSSQSPIQEIIDRHDALCIALFGHKRGNKVIDQQVIHVIREVRELADQLYTNYYWTKRTEDNLAIKARIGSAGERAAAGILEEYLEYNAIAKLPVVEATDAVVLTGGYDDADPAQTEVIR